MKLCDSSQCYGCFACVNSCPKNCITMTVGVNGHIFPTIDTDKCINCGLCKKSCPGLMSFQLNKPSHVYAAWNLDHDEQIKSSSGGIAWLLAKRTIQDGGVVYGAAFDKDWNVNHVRCQTETEIQLLSQSKYVQSWINDAYSQVKADLNSNLKVLFVGTPCQIAGLKAFLKRDYETLVTVDLVCHGTPSRKMLREELEEITQFNDLKKVAFRGSYGYGFRFDYQDGFTCFTIRQSYYLKGFMDGLFYRESCYHCPFAGKNRVGDLTVGDFWGIGKKQPFDNPDKNKVSLVLVNTERGEKCFSTILDNVYCQERTLEEAIDGNPQLQRPSMKPKNYEKFKRIYSKKGLKKAAERAYPKMRTRLFLEKLGLIKVTR